MRKIRSTRKARFKAALALAGVSQAEWARENSITPEHLNAVISEVQSRESKALEGKIDAFIEDVFAKVRAA